MKKPKRKKQNRKPKHKFLDINLRIPMDTIVSYGEDDFMSIHTAMLLLNRSPIVTDEVWAELIKSHIQFGRYN